MIGTYALSSGYYVAYYIKPSRCVPSFKRDFERAFEQVTPSPAPRPDAGLGRQREVSDPLAMFLWTSTPSPSIGGDPGDQRARRHHAAACHRLNSWTAFGEERLLRIAHEYQLRTDWHERHTGNVVAD
jgi:aspartyl-tRNA(Asn)/glutamyl-tRNA(Gln) amidotransferase subunit A